MTYRPDPPGEEQRQHYNPEDDSVDIYKQGEFRQNVNGDFFNPDNVSPRADDAPPAPSSDGKNN